MQGELILCAPVSRIALISVGNTLSTEEDPSPGWTEAICVMCTEGIITELQHIQ